jgi:hypothetical protein
LAVAGVIPDRWGDPFSLNPPGWLIDGRGRRERGAFRRKPRGGHETAKGQNEQRPVPVRGQGVGVNRRGSYLLLFGYGGGPGRTAGFVASSCMMTSIAFSSCWSSPANSFAGSLSTTISGSIPTPSMGQVFPSVS